MDLRNLTPAAPSPSKSTTTTTRSQTPATVFETADAATAATGTPVTALPVKHAPEVGDRVERSRELDRHLAELKSELSRQPPLRKERVAELMREITSSKRASPETLMRAAAGILHGELFFTED